MPWISPRGRHWPYVAMHLWVLERFPFALASE
jgi:hypothetical protein